MFGYGFRKWRCREHCYDEQVCKIAKVAAEGIKDIMRSDIAQEGRAEITAGCLVGQHTGRSPRLQKRKLEYVTDCCRQRHADAVANTRPQQAEQPAGEEFRQAHASAGAPKAEQPAGGKPLEADVVAAANARLQQVALPAGGELRQPHAAVAAGARKLRAHHSDESTCVPNTLLEEQEEGAGGSASCTDTDEWEPADRRRSHPRHARRGRRAKARARREHWEEVKQEACRDAIGGSDRHLFGTLLACIEEGEGDDHQVAWGRDMLIHEGGFEATQMDSDPDMDPASNSSHNLVEKMHRCERGGVSTLSSTDSHVASPQTKENEREEGTGEESGQPHSRRPALVQEDLADEVDGMPWDHDLFEDVKEGVKLIPAQVAVTLIRYQMVAQRCKLDSLETLRRDIVDIKLRVDDIEEAVNIAESWECPKFLASQWEELKEWLFIEKGGPSQVLQRWELAYEEATDAEVDWDFAQKELESELAFSGEVMAWCWDGIIEKIADIERAGAREAYRKLRRVDRSDVSSLPSEDIQRLIDQRLERSRSCPSTPHL